VSNGFTPLALAPTSVEPARRREVAKGRGNAAGTDLERRGLNTAHQRRRPDWTGRKHASAPRKGLEGNAPGPAGFGDSTVVLADRMDQAEVDERRSSNRTSLGSGQGEGGWVLAIGRTMAATQGTDGESRRRPGGTAGAEAKARRQSRAEVAGGRGFTAAKATVERVIAGDRGQGASIALRRWKAPGVKEASRVDARLVDIILGSGTPKGAARVTRVSAAIVPNRLGKAEEAPERAWMGEGRKPTWRARARRIARRQDANADRRRGHQSTRSPFCQTAGGTSIGQSPKLDARRQTRSGTREFRRASVRRESHADLAGQRVLTPARAGMGTTRLATYRSREA